METKLNVSILAHTTVFDDTYLPDQGAVLSTFAAKQCYNSTKFDINTEKVQAKNDKHYLNLLGKVTDSGHMSVLEHGSVTFLITGVSRALSHQLVRHRIASYTQQSQRYTNMEEFNHVVPESIKNNKQAYSLFKRTMVDLKEAYKELVELLEADKIKGAKEDARFVLPNACATQLVMTMNYRELGDFLGKRMCNRAQWEIRELATEIYKLMNKYEPTLFGPNGVFKGPKCENLGYCNECNSCGRKAKNK